MFRVLILFLLLSLLLLLVLRPPGAQQRLPSLACFYLPHWLIFSRARLVVAP